jgi:acyl dehydratase
MRLLVAGRTFSMRDQDHFAALSGDRNPIHVDPLFARRTQAGAPVAHGMHAVLWALDELVRRGRFERPVATLAVEFRRFIYLGDAATLFVVEADDARLRAEIVSAEAVATTIDLTFGVPADAPPGLAASADSVEALPEGLRGFAGRTGSFPAPAIDRSAFPYAAERLGPRAIATLAGLSYLIGMVCPGLHSLFSSFRLSLRPLAGDAVGDGAIVFGVTKIDARFSLVDLSIDGPGASGTVTAFVRPAPVVQRAFREVAGLVGAAEFAGIRALVVGGSRGLGAATARIVAAGGGRVTITYAAGEAEARELAAEIGPDRCEVLRYDIRDEAGSQLESVRGPIDQLYYFASAHIHRQRSGPFVEPLFAEFCTFYIRGFVQTWSALRERAGTLRTFYPSSLAVAERPRNMTEYAMAKAAGEVLCADLHRSSPATPILVERLGRVLTDQTATVIPVHSLDAVDVMLPLVRKLHTLPVRGV